MILKQFRSTKIRSKETSQKKQWFPAINFGKPLLTMLASAFGWPEVQKHGQYQPQ